MPGVLQPPADPHAPQQTVSSSELVIERGGNMHDDEGCQNKCEEKCAVKVG
jgi:hypothetical protein